MRLFEPDDLIVTAPDDAAVGGPDDVDPGVVDRAGADPAVGHDDGDPGSVARTLADEIDPHWELRQAFADHTRGVEGLKAATVTNRA